MLPSLLAGRLLLSRCSAASSLLPFALEATSFSSNQWRLMSKTEQALPVTEHSPIVELLWKERASKNQETQEASPDSEPKKLCVLESRGLARHMECPSLGGTAPQSMHICALQVVMDAWLHTIH